MPSDADEPSVANPRTPSPIRLPCRLLCRSPVALPVFPAAAVALRRRVLPRARNASASRTARPRCGPGVLGLARVRAHLSLCLGPRPPPCRRVSDEPRPWEARASRVRTHEQPYTARACIPSCRTPLTMPSPSPSSRRSLAHAGASTAYRRAPRVHLCAHTHGTHICAHAPLPAAPDPGTTASDPAETDMWDCPVSRKGRRRGGRPAQHSPRCDQARRRVCHDEFEAQASLLHPKPARQS
jgi:hypothetical protein